MVLEHRHIIYDALRASDYNQHNVPIHIMSFLWVYGWVGALSGMLLMVVTWVSFSSKNLLERPALTGNPTMFWGIEIPMLVITLGFAVAAGQNYWWYFVCMRACVAAWSALSLILALIAAYYGGRTISRLREGGDSFGYRQQLRVLIVIVGAFLVCAICLGVQGFFLDTIDNFYQIYLLCTTFYRLTGLSVTLGSALYVSVATAHYVKISNSTRTNSNSTRKFSDMAPSTAQSSYYSTKSGDSSSSNEEEAEKENPKDDTSEGASPV